MRAEAGKSSSIQTFSRRLLAENGGIGAVVISLKFLRRGKGLSERATPPEISYLAAKERGQSRGLTLAHDDSQTACKTANERD